MSFPVAETIKKIGVDRLKAETGIPRRTLYRWAKNDKVAGTGVVHDLRLNLLKEAADKLDPPAKPKKRARAA